jgi:hypothetical protein
MFGSQLEQGKEKLIEKETQKEKVISIQKQIEISKQRELIEREKEITKELQKGKITDIGIGIPLFGLPGGAGGGGARSERGAFAFREVSPTWTPGEMGRALFTGSFSKPQTVRQTKRLRMPRLPKAGLPKAGKKRGGKKSILKGR